MTERLQVTNAIAHYQKAAELDPRFAWAELSLANGAPTGKEFFEPLDKAVALSDKASEGERLLIQSAKAMARVAIAKKDIAGAKKDADAFRAGAASSKNPFQVKNSREIDGSIALAENDWDRAISELSQANSQNPQNLYRLCQAYAGSGETAKAAESCKAAAEFNSLPNVNLALIRTKARAQAAVNAKKSS